MGKKIKYVSTGIRVNKSNATKVWESEDYRPFPEDSMVYASNRRKVINYYVPGFFEKIQNQLQRKTLGELIRGCFLKKNN